MSGVVSEDKRKCVPPLGSLPVTHFPEVSLLLLRVLSVLRGFCVGAGGTFRGYNSEAGKLVSTGALHLNNEQTTQTVDAFAKKTSTPKVNSELALQPIYFCNVKMNIFNEEKKGEGNYWIVKMGITYLNRVRPEAYFSLILQKSIWRFHTLWFVWKVWVFLTS